jgi:tetratricopeptide (TPR) repeat protein
MPQVFGQPAPPVLTEIPRDLPAIAALGSSEAETDRFRLFDAVAATVRNFSIATPLLIVLDDLHAADQGSILLLQFLVRTMGRARVAVVASYREAEVRRQPRLSELIGDLCRDGRTIPLRGLSRDDIWKFVELSTGTAPDDATVESLHAATEGNPFFLTEIVQLLMAERRFAGGQATRRENFRMPDGVRSAIRRRIDPITRDALEMLEIGSVIGPEFGWTFLRALCAHTSERLAAGLDEAVSHGLISEVGDASGLYRFNHALIAQTIYGDLPKERRQKLHAAIAVELERLHGIDSQTELSEVAHHYYRALPLANVDKAVLYGCLAARRAMSSLAYEEASRLYSMALRALESRPSADASQHCELLLHLAEAQGRARDFKTFKQSIKRAAEIARSIGNARYLARAALAYKMLDSEPGRPDLTAIGLLREAIAAIGSDEPALRAVMLARLADEIRWTASDAETAAIIDESLAIARKVEDPEALLEALYIKYHTMRGPDVSDQRYALATELVRMTQKYGLEDWSFRARYHRSSVLLELGASDELEIELAAMRRIPEPIRLQQLGFSEIIDATVALIQGRVDEGERLAMEALRIGRGRPNTIAEQIFSTQITVIRREQGRLAELIPANERFVTRHPEQRFARSALAFCYSQIDHRARARAEFNALASDGFASFKRDFMWLGSMAYLAETCSYLADAERAARLYEMLAPYRSRNASLGFFAYLGPIAHYLGILAVVLSRFDEAEGLFKAALESEQRMRALPWVARSQYRLAELLGVRGGQGDRERGVELLIESLETAEALAIRSLAERVRALRSSYEVESTVPRGIVPIAFQREGDYWTIGRPDEVFRFKDIKGFSYIACLLRDPGREIHALDLFSGANAGSSGIEVVFTEGGASTEDNLRVATSVDAGAMLDVQAKAAYKRRLTELRQELEGAKEQENEARAARIEDEIDALARELSRAIGLGGRDRRAASASERARLNVTRAIKAAIGRIAERDAPLGVMLAKSIKTGTFCSYVPRPSEPVAWKL